jgi:hypothetical protein
MGRAQFDQIMVGLAMLSTLVLLLNGVTNQRCIQGLIIHNKIQLLHTIIIHD